MQLHGLGASAGQLHGDDRALRRVAFGIRRGQEIQFLFCIGKQGRAIEARQIPAQNLAEALFLLVARGVGEAVHDHFRHHVEVDEAVEHFFHAGVVRLAVGGKEMPGVSYLLQERFHRQLRGFQRRHLLRKARSEACRKQHQRA